MVFEDDKIVIVSLLAMNLFVQHPASALVIRHVAVSDSCKRLGRAASRIGFGCPAGSSLGVMMVSAAAGFWAMAKISIVQKIWKFRLKF